MIYPAGPPDAGLRVRYMERQRVRNLPATVIIGWDVCDWTDKFAYEKNFNRGKIKSKPEIAASACCRSQPMGPRR